MSNESYFVNTQPTIYGTNTLQLAITDALLPIEERSLTDWNTKNPSYGQSLDLTQCAQVLVPDANSGQQAVNYQTMVAYSGGGSNVSLNVTNNLHPLTGDLDLRNSSYRLKTTDPLQPSDVAIKSWVEDQISHYTPTAIEALGDITSRTNMAQNGRFTYIQGVMKESVMNGLTTEYQPLRYDQDYQIIDPNQLVTYAQATLGIEEEKNERIAADTQLQQNIDDLRNTPLNQWPTPMTPGILMNNFEMNGNNISGLAIQPQNGTPDNYAARVSYVNESVNNLGFTLGGQISNVKVECETYTDESVLSLRTYTDNQLATKQDIVPLNEIPLPEAFVSMNGHRITQLADPYYLSDAISLGQSNLRYLPLNAQIDLTNHRITNVADAINPTDVPTYQQVINGQGISQEYADTHYLAINTPLNEINAPISVLSMNNQNIIDLPLVPLGLNNACSVQYATGLANTAVANPISDIDLSNTHKIKNCMNPIDQQDVVTLNYFENNLPVSSSNQITNNTFSSVTVNPDQSTTFVNNSNIVLQVNPTTIVANQPIFSTTQPAFDPSNQLLTKQQLDPYYLNVNTSLNDINAPSADLNMNSQRIQNLADPLQAQDAVTLTYLENNPVYFDTNQIVNNGKLSYVLVNDDQQIIFQNNNAESMHITPTQIVTNQPIFSTVAAPGDTSNAILTRSQLDPYYYAYGTTLNHINYADGDVSINGHKITDVLDPTQLYDVANKNYVDSNIRSANKINSNANHAIVQCENGSDNVSIKANNASTNLVITATNNTQYKLANAGDIAIDTQGKRINLNQAAIEIVGSNQNANINVLGPIISYAADSGLGNQVLNRTQNDARYLTSTTTLSSIGAPTSSVDFSGQLIKNLQTPTQTLDAANKSYVDTSLSNYSTSTQVDSKISSALTPYSTTNQMNSAISTALVPYITSSTAASTYQRQDTPFSKIVNGNNTIEAQTSNSGHKIYGGLSGAKQEILDIFAPSGQPAGSCQIQSLDKLILVSPTGSTSIYSGTGQLNSNIYVGSSSDNPAQNCYDQIVIGNGRSTAPQLTLSSGHSASNIPYSIICNTNTTALNNLQLSPEISANVLTGNALNMYSSALISTFPILNQFTQPTGRSGTQSTAQTNEFITKGYADAHYTGGGIQSLIQDSTTANKVACSSSNVQIYTPLISGSPSLIFKQSSSFPTYLEMNPSNVTGGLYISYPNIILQVAPTCFNDQTTASNSQLIQKQYADNQYAKLNGALNQLSAPTTAFNFNSQQITSLSSGGVISASNTNAINASDLFNYVTNANSTQQTWTITLNGSSSTGIQWGNIPSNLSTNYAQTQKVKGSAGNLITSATIGCVSTTLASSWAIFDLQCASNVRITQVWAYSTTSAGTGSQQNIASLTYSQQPSSISGHTNLQLYKPATSQGSDAFILYFVVDSY